MKSKVIKGIVAGIVIIALGVGGYFAYKTFFAKKTVASAVQYYTVSARKMNLNVTVQGTGTAYAAVTKQVTANNTGTIKDLNVKVGDTVTAGQKLFVSDSDALRKAVTTAQNNLAKQNLTLSSDQSAEKVDANRVAMDKLNVSDAQTQLNEAYTNLNNMTVKAPIGGVITAVNASNGDSSQSSGSGSNSSSSSASSSSSGGVLTIVDMNSIKIKLSVDELDIEKVKAGQTAQVKFDAIKDKTFEGTVETVAAVGTTSNNVTTYDVVVGIKDPAGIKLGMNGNVTISVESKQDALVIPAEALVDNNGQKFVRVESASTTTSAQSSSNNSTSDSNQQAQTNNTQNTNGNKTASNGKNSNGGYGQRNSQGYGNGSNAARGMATTASSGRLIAVKTGMETENYVEITEGVTEGEKVLVQLPQTTTTTNSNRSGQNSAFGGNMGGFGGGMQGGFGGGQGGQRSNSGSTGGKN
ncbi:efflux RND transporter periplasmic adaptor subunit [Clostridium sp. YIM B02505]|uniref:Efflux RND transporter periplasmic adaptor subunit n=1 Tax=Clostridium yunnanense TaxID=2800325 RepID=A0ABS1EWH2_9CLOT|nr:efflux RND transporter periplasmic adaptor subunit [Clostridium yunnanense]MBK1813735.1 efflux RND transporter periplasmic adaptor subunit [Clostridium yunnanense]